MRTRSSPVVALLAVVLIGAALAGCGGSTGDDAAQPGVTMSSSPSSAPSSGPSSTPPPPGDRGTPSGRVPPASQPATTPAELALTGQPEEGVEAGCVVMRSGGTLYLLIGGDRQMLSSGRPVVVRGRVAAGLMTICQQGTPFQVSEVRLA